MFNIIFKTKYLCRNKQERINILKMDSLPFSLLYLTDLDNRNPNILKNTIYGSFPRSITKLSCPHSETYPTFLFSCFHSSHVSVQPISATKNC